VLAKLASDNRPDQWSIATQRLSDPAAREPQVIDGVERTDRDT
jgi:hypothetical protein